MSEKPSDHTDIKDAERYNRNLDTRDICGPKISHYGRNNVELPNPSVFAGVRKGAFDTVSQNGGSFFKPSRNTSTAFSHLDMTAAAYNVDLQKKMEANGKVNHQTKSKADPAAMIIAGMPVQPEPFSITQLLSSKG